MILRQLIPLISSLAAVTALTGCGNKGDLYLIPDPVSQQDMEQFQQVLDLDEVPVAEPLEVGDEDIYVKPGKKDAARSGSDEDEDPVENPAVDTTGDPTESPAE